MGHFDFELCLKILREELPAHFLKPPLEMFVHTMTDNIKEPPVATCLSNSARDFVATFFSRHQRTYVDNRNM